MAEEAAFLESMQATNHFEGSYNGNGGGIEQQAESEPDEYDPSQTVQTEMPPSLAQDPNVPFLSHDPTSHSNLPSASAVLLNSTSSSVLQPQQDHFPSDRQSLSRSMSPASSQSLDVDVVTDTPDDLKHSEGDQAQEGTAIGVSEGREALDTGHKLSLPPGSGPELNISTNGFSADNVALQNDVQDQTSSSTAQNGAAQNGAANTVPNLAAVIPDTGAASHQEPTAKPAETLPAPLVTDTPAASKAQPPTPSMAAPRARLPHDTIGILEDRIKEDPRGDLQAWLHLLNEHKKRGKIDDARDVYERFLALFPSAGDEWVHYAQMENEAENRGAMEKILGRALPQNPHLPLWSLYLDHIRRHNILTTDASGKAREIIQQAYDAALQYVGLDKDSGKLWQDYVQFIRSGPGNIGGSTWQDQQKMDLLRRVYQQAICVPTQNTNMLWKEYDGFERGLNKMTGQKFLQEQSPAYMSARSSFTALQNITAQLQRSTLPVLPPVLGSAGDAEFIEQLEIWKRWIQWEKDDPLVLKQEDIAAYRARILFVYKHALMAMRFWPELWVDASDFCFQNDLEVEGNEFLIHGVAANPESCLLAFKRADRLELSTANEESDQGALRRGTAVREPYNKVLDALYELCTKTKSREAQDIARIEASFTENKSLQNGTAADDDHEVADAEEEASKDKQKAAQIESTKSMHAVQLALLSKTLSHVWIALIRAMRRVQGKGKVNDPLAGLRGTFADARKRGRLTSDVYAACALIEFHCYEPETGKKIFERGLKLFPEDEAFALEYIKHLVSNNDHTNARVVFETAVTKLAQKPETVSNAKPLYAFFHDFESRYGELNQIVKLEKRMSDLFPEDPALALFSRRYQEQGFDPTTIRPIISPATQTRQKTIPSIDEAPPQSPPGYLNATFNSPKRPLPTEDSDTEGPPTKMARNNNRDVSPMKVQGLKGAAGRRLDQQNRNRSQDMPQFSQQHPMPMQPLPPPPLPRDVTFLLSIIPKSETYQATPFIPDAMVRLIRNTNIPTSMNDLPSNAVGRVAPPVHQIQPPPHFQQMQPMTHGPPMTTIAHGQYPGQFNGLYPNFPYVSAYGSPAHAYSNSFYIGTPMAFPFAGGPGYGLSQTHPFNVQSYARPRPQTFTAVAPLAGPSSSSAPDVPLPPAQVPP